MKHEFKVEEKYEDDNFLGDLYTCTKCGYEHLCANRISITCTHLDAFYTGCTNEKTNDK